MNPKAKPQVFSWKDYSVSAMPESADVKLFLFHSLSKSIQKKLNIYIYICIYTHTLTCIICYLVSAALIKKEGIADTDRHVSTLVRSHVLFLFC